MKHQNVKVVENGAKITLNLGRQGEYNVRDVIFDMSDFQQKYGDGTATIVHFPANGSAYTVPSLSGESKDSAILDGESLIWTIGKLATRYDGNGIAIITWVTLDGLKKSIKYNTYCKESVGDYGADKSAQQSYIDQMAELAATLSDLTGNLSEVAELAAEISEARENALSDIETQKNGAVNDINTAKSGSIEGINSAKELALDELDSEKEEAISSIRAARNVSVTGETLIFGGV